MVMRTKLLHAAEAWPVQKNTDTAVLRHSTLHPQSETELTVM